MLNILSGTKQGAKFRINLAGVPKEEVCSVQGGLKDFCVTKF